MYVCVYVSTQCGHTSERRGLRAAIYILVLWSYLKPFFFSFLTNPFLRELTLGAYVGIFDKYVSAQFGHTNERRSLRVRIYWSSVVT